MNTKFTLILTILIAFSLAFGCTQYPPSSGVPETSAKAAWKAAEPWAIVDWSRGESGLMVIVQNNSNQSLNLTRFDVSQGDGLDLNVILAPGATRQILALGLDYCPSNTKYNIDKDAISITYNTDNILGKNQYGAADIVGTCQ
jgi:hypothetical protein